jgi:hypothetical protein
VLPFVSEAKHLLPASFVARNESALFSAFERIETNKDGVKGEWMKPTLLAEFAAYPRDDFADGGGLGVVENHAEALAAHQAQIAADPKARTSNIVTQDAVLPGVPFFLGIRLRDATPAQAGLVLKALKAWSNKNALGGGASRGFGRFTIAATLYLETDDGLKAVGGEGGLLGGEAPTYTLTPAVKDLIEAAEKEISEISRAQIEAIFPSVDPAAAAAQAKAKAEEKARKKAEKEAGEAKAGQGEEAESAKTESEGA